MPGWVKNPLGKYYMYFAHHRGAYIRLAYADSLRGPWKVYVPGVLQVTQVTVSPDGLHFNAQPAIIPEPYLGVFQHGGEYYGIVRLGRLAHAADPLQSFQKGHDPLRDPAIYLEKAATGADRLTLFYTVCGEQGIAAADVEIGRP